jgi:quinoprotein glucose dehydrogenase
MATTDLRLVAIDATSGRRCESFGANGEINVGRAVREEVEAKAAAIGRAADFRHGDLQFSSPPVIVDDIVLIGSSNNTKFRRDDGPSGKVRAFDARTGEPRWTFDPVPRNADDPEAKNWTAAALRTVGAANVWSMMSVDEERGLVFLPTASASPDFYGGNRPGDNRYANSVVALHTVSGRVAWHFQIVHHDVWDLDTPAQPILTTIRKDGKAIPVVIQLTKQGFVFVLHRETGAPVFPVEERPVPTEAVPGEVLSPTQPFPVLPAPLVPQGIHPSDAWGFTFFDRSFCREWISRLRHDNYYAAPSEQGTAMFPGMGVNNWGGGAIDVKGNALIVPINRAMTLRRLVPVTSVDAETLANPMAGLMGNVGALAGTPYAQQFQPMLSPLFSPCNPPPWGELAAIDLDSGLVRWRRTLGVLDKLMPVPIPLPWGTPNSGGPIVTDSGLVFIGATMDERFRAFDAQTGEQLWATETPSASMATPMTYQAEGRQFVVIASGGHMWQYAFKISDYLLAYALVE